MKLYYIDLHYRGGQVVVAESPAQAWELLTAADEYNELSDNTVDDLKEKEIAIGTIIAFQGDA